MLFWFQLVIISSMTFDELNLYEWFSDPGIIIPAILLVIVFAAWINRTALSRRWQFWRTDRLLNNLGLEQICNLPCPDGLDGEFVLDRLVKLPDEIVLIVFKRFPGNIYCAEKISQWTQVLAQKSYKFENPLFELENQVTALAEMIPGTPVRGYLFFDPSALFPKGCPDAVLSPGNIPDKFSQLDGMKVENRISAAWEVLTRLSSESSPHQQLRLRT